MSATDELRRMLDERGVEWWEDAFACEHRTVFDGKDGVRYCVYQLGSVLFISSELPVTPEQAIAATLGGGECEREKHGVKMDGSPRLRCSLCGYGIGDKRFNYCPNCGAKVMG